MSPEDSRKQDIRKLLGGYAAGILTPEEQQALFAAALEDQDLFDDLAREQSLRDLLRDPSARAELLSALDTPSRGMSGFWQWLRRPAVAGLATACVLTIAVVAVWRGTRTAPLKPAAPMIIAEVKPMEPPATRAPAPLPPPAGQQGARLRLKDVAPNPGAMQDTVAMSDKKTEVPTATLLKERRAEQDVAPPVAATAPPPVPAPPSVMPRKAEATSQTVEVQALSGAIGGIPESVALDARTLFYLNQLPPGANAFMEPAPGGRGGASPTSRQAQARADAPESVKSATSPPAPTFAITPAPRLGVRVSILRGDREVDLGTALNPGETIRLKLIPNADGFLSVAEGTRTLASGPAQRLTPFETPELRFEGSGQRQLVVTLSRTPLTGEALSIGTLGRGNVVAPAADQGHATYVVTGAASRQVVVPVTLTYQ